MDHHIHQIDAGPLAVIAGPGQGAKASLLAQFFCVSAGGLHLADAGTGRQDHEIGYRRQTPHVQDDDVMAARVSQQSCSLNGKLFGVDAVIARIMRWCSGYDTPPTGSAKYSSRLTHCAPHN